MNAAETAAHIKANGLTWKYDATMGLSLAKGEYVFGLAIKYHATPDARRWTKGFTIWANNGETAEQLITHAKWLLAHEHSP